jgi:hypothetical protein
MKPISFFSDPLLDIEGHACKNATYMTKNMIDTIIMLQRGMTEK